ncbi:hypothetical protein LEP1GSC195_2006 [Leptospira wolbachii serovar Codice str. CDC]|uniref:Uncharacterized protein n=1 Tax=Leptospira wolbachii serovar Codice str. CDC TaxID=1218599 RepID=R9A0Q3_9LEPT|nr:hypothetical protein LEP1GSC195_2006 [Leptospira wolbachii serovar Codice str. CDC]
MILEFWQLYRICNEKEMEKSSYFLVFSLVSPLQFLNLGLKSRKNSEN